MLVAQHGPWQIVGAQVNICCSRRKGEKQGEKQENNKRKKITSYQKGGNKTNIEWIYLIQRTCV